MQAKGCDKLGGLLPVLTSALFVGLGCGSCCSPAVSAFLSSYSISHGDGAGQGLKYFLCFFAGKLAAIVFLCIISSVLGVGFVSETGYIGGFNLRLFAQIGMSGAGAYMLFRFFWERKNSRCAVCKECGKSEEKRKEKSLPLFLAGLAYGFTPCAPMMVILGYAFTLPLVEAALSGTVFSLATMLSPILFVSILTGALSPRLRKEIPGFLSGFKVASYAALIIMPYFVGL